MVFDPRAGFQRFGQKGSPRSETQGKKAGEQDRVEVRGDREERQLDAGVAH